MSKVLNLQVGTLHEGPVNLRLQGLSSVFCQSPLIHMPDDSNNDQLHPRLARIRGEIEEMDVFTDGILASKIFLREAGIDNCDARGMLGIRLRDEASTQQRNTHGLQVVRFDD